MDHHIEDDAPPFALDTSCGPQHLFRDGNVIPAALSASISRTYHEKKVATSYNANKVGVMEKSQASAPPGLAESMVTDGSSSETTTSMSQDQSSTHHIGASSNFMLSSLPTISSSIGNSSHITHIDSVLHQPVKASTQQEWSGSRNSNHRVTFSQLMREVDAQDAPLQTSSMPVVPEEGYLENFSPLRNPPSLGPSPFSSPPRQHPWQPLNLFGNPPRTFLEEPLLGPEPSSEAPLLARTPSDAALQRARTSIRSCIEDDQTFEISMDVPASSDFQSVMNVLGHPELLPMWCDPIRNLVVTSASDGNTGDLDIQRGDEREYEGEWIEATTTALDSPPCTAGYIHTAGQVVLDALGFAGYGKITMFVERQRGRVGLTIGPFSGGINASHHICLAEVEGKLRITDRVCLTRDMEGASMTSAFLCGVLDSCMLTPCLMPSMKAYMEQVTTSMARLRILMENKGLYGQEIIGPAV